MYITSLKLKNIKCFEKLDYDFENDHGASLVIAGDNGDGKSTILRSIAISLCDQWTAAGLLRELSGEFIKSGEEDGYIILELQNGSASYTITTTITWNDSSSYEYPKRTIMEKLNGQDLCKPLEDYEFPWEDVFASGYGAGLRTSGTADFQYYFTGDSIYSLFSENASLQSPELAIRRITGSMPNSKLARSIEDEILKWLGDLLLLENKKLKLKPNGIYIVDNENEKIQTALAASGDGYKAVTFLVLDMLSWWFLNQFYDAETGELKKQKEIRNAPTELKSINGIVIIDELEQHLHPRWQKEILPILSATFSSVQFIISTHSPLVVSGAKSQILILENGEERKEKLYGWLAEDVYEAMGVGPTRTPEVTKLIEEFEVLFKESLRQDLKGSKQKDFDDLYSKLSEILPSHDPVLQTIKLSSMKEFLRSE